MENQCDDNEVKENFNELLALVQDISHRKAKLYEGKVMEALVEGINEHDTSLVTGRLSNNLLVHFTGDESLIGELVNVRLVECMGFYYMGERI